MTHSQQIQHYNLFDAFRKNRVRMWAPKVYKALINIIKQVTNEDSIQLAISSIDRNIRYDELSSIIGDIYIDAGRVMGAKAYQVVMQQVRVRKKAFAGFDEDEPIEIKRMMPIGFNEELVNEIIAYLRFHNLQMVLQISQSLKEWIVKQLIDAQYTGQSIQNIANELVKHDFPKNRAIVIARTETIKAANAGQIRGAKKAGYKTNKIWISTKDNRTRRTPRDTYNHLVMNGTSIDIDEYFMVPNKNGSYDKLMQPGDPSGNPADTIQCRCCCGFDLVKGEDGLPIRL